MFKTHLYAPLVCFKYLKPNLQKPNPNLLHEAFFQPRDSFRRFAEHQHSPLLGVLIPHLKNTLTILQYLKKKNLLVTNVADECYFVSGFPLWYSFTSMTKIKGISLETSARAKSGQAQSKSPLLQHMQKVCQDQSHSVTYHLGNRSPRLCLYLYIKWARNRILPSRPAGTAFS